MEFQGERVFDIHKENTTMNSLLVATWTHYTVGSSSFTVSSILAFHWFFSRIWTFKTWHTF